MSENEKNKPEAELSEEKLDGVTGGFGDPFEKTYTRTYYKCPRCQEWWEETMIKTISWNCVHCLKPINPATAEKKVETYTRKSVTIDTPKLPKH